MYVPSLFKQDDVTVLHQAIREIRLGTLVTLGAGEAIGEGLLLDDSAHGTTARALVAAQALLLTRPKVDEIIHERPTLYAALVARAARAISERLRATDATLAGHGRLLGFTGARTRSEHDLLRSVYSREFRFIRGLLRQ